MTAPDLSKLAASLSDARRRALMALPKSEGVWLTVSEMRGNGATGAGMDILYVYTRGLGQLCDRRWATWGPDRVNGQRRGEGYEYCITPLGLQLRRYLQEIDRG